MEAINQYPFSPRHIASSMQRFACLVAFVLALTGVSPAGTLTVPISAPAPVSTTAGADNTRHDFVNSLATDGHGHWVCAWHSMDSTGAGGFGTDNDIFVSRSANDGQTWSAAAPLNTTATTDGSSNDRMVSLATDGAGLWMAVWMSNNPINGTGPDIDILMSRSTDGGATWTPPVALATNAEEDSGNDFDPMIYHSGSTWLVVWRTIDTLGGTLETDGDLLWVRSVNNGVNWSDPAPLNTNATNDSQIDQAAQLATDGTGLWVCVWQSKNDIAGAGNSDDDIHYSRSVNDGVSWSPPAILNSNAPANRADVTPHVAFGGFNEWKVVWSSQDPLNNTIGTDNDIFFSTSDDGGQNWTLVQVLNTNADDDDGDDLNPRLAVDAQARWVAAWHSNSTLDGTIETDNDILFANSDDGGLTWNNVAPIHAYAEEDSGLDELPIIMCDGSGAWFITWETRANPSGNIGGDRDIVFSRFAFPDCNENTLPDVREIDCNENNTPDDCDIDSGSSDDLNRNGIPDECEEPIDPCPADIDNSGTVNITDLLAVIANWGAPGGAADVNGDNTVNITDLLAVIANWGPCE